jgi:hypothetical protein
MQDKAQRRMIVRSNFLPKVPPTKSSDTMVKDVSFGGGQATVTIGSKQTFGSTITITE